MKERNARSASVKALGLPIETAMSQRDELAKEHGPEFGQEWLFGELVDALLAEIPEGASVLEVGAATGAFTRLLLGKASHVTALEVSPGMLQKLMESDIAGSPKLRVLQGVVEELPYQEMYDLAVVTFTPRRGVALSTLMIELGQRVADRIIVVFREDLSMDWAYLARDAANQGFDVRLHVVSGDDSRAVILVADVKTWEPRQPASEEWGLDMRETEVPFPPPRGSAARLVRYFLTISDRALLVKTDPKGIARLYGNLRTAAHRLSRGEVTVRMHQGHIHLVRLPKA